MTKNPMTKKRAGGAVFAVAAVLTLALALAGCPNEKKPNNPNNGGGDSKEFSITYNLNWPDDADNAAPAVPAAVKTNATTGKLTTTQAGYTGGRPEIEGFDVLFGGWFTTKAAADGTSAIGVVVGGTAANATEFTKDETLYARWNREAKKTLDLTGKDVELVTNANNAFYPLYQFTLPDGKTWADYKTVSFEMAVDADNYEGSVGSFRLMGNYKGREDFTFVTGTGDIAGKKLAAALTDNGNIEINRNGPYIMHNGGGATVGSIYDTFGAGGTPNEWVTLTFPNFDTMTPHAQFTGDPISERNKPAGGDTGPFYFGVGTTNITYYVKNVTLVGNSAADNVKGVPVIWKVALPGIDDAPALYPAYAPGYSTANGGDGVKETSRAFVNPTGNSEPIEITITDNRATVTFDYNYPTGVSLTQPPAEDREKTTDVDGHLEAGDLTALTGTDVPDGYEFIGWYLTQHEADATPAPTDVVTVLSVFEDGDEVYAFWKAQLLPKPTKEIVLEGANVFGVYGNNAKADYDSTTGTATIAAAGADYAFMTGTGDYNAHFGITGTVDTQVSVAFPAEVREFLYEKVIVYYEAIQPETVKNATDSTIDVNTTDDEAYFVLPATGEVVNASKDAILKDGYADVSKDAVALDDNIYPTFVSGANQKQTWSLAKFVSESTKPGWVSDPGPWNGFGFTLQNNAYGGTQATPKAMGWLLKITKVVFTTAELEAAGGTIVTEILNPEVTLLGNNTEDGSIELDDNTGVITVENFKTRTNLGFNFPIPEAFVNFKNIKVDYTITFGASGTGPVQLTTKVGATMNTDTIPPEYGPNYTATGEYTRVIPVSTLKNASNEWLGSVDTTNLMTFQVNTWGDAGLNKPMNFTIHIDKVSITR
jgi:uncharacterized lipoprotein NlpE involved in copper resistance